MNLLSDMSISLRGVAKRTENGRPVLAIADPNALTQTVGWLKFAHGQGQVLYRGQTELYPDIRASGLRGEGIAARRKLASLLREYVNDLSGAECLCPMGPFHYGQAHECLERVQRRKPASLGLVQSTYRAAVEPLVQHYGVRTRWLDVVDNIWIALWFACHQQVTVGEFAHHQRRSEALEGPGAKAYIIVMSTGVVSPTGVPGYHVGDETRVIDLRYAVPSVYLRPHAQHGLLVAPAKLADGATGSLNSNVIAELEIALADALRWLGDGVMTSPFVLFPPATVDVGYRRLMAAVSPHPDLGTVMHYGPGI